MSAGDFLEIGQEMASLASGIHRVYGKLINDLDALKLGKYDGLVKAILKESVAEMGIVIRSVETKEKTNE